MGCGKSRFINKEIVTTVSKESAANKEIRKKYNIKSQVLGAGRYGKVYLGSAVKDDNFQVAIRVISKDAYSEQLSDIRQEIKNLQKLDHPNIIKYFETYENAKYIYIVTEYWAGGDLIDTITKTIKENGAFKETEAAEIMEKILKAVNHSHLQNIGHLNIKPEKILFGNDGELKLIDFGLATLAKNISLKSLSESPYYFAPEVFERKPWIASDIWSLGVILYVLLSGYMPFAGDTKKEMINNIKNGEFYFEQKEWESVSQEAKELIIGMLEVKIKKRLTATQCLTHKWFTSEQGDKFERLDTDLLDNLIEYKSESKFK